MEPQSFVLNDNAWKRALLLGGGPTGLGLIVLIGVIVSFIDRGAVDPVPALISLSALGIGGWMLRLFWPSFKSINVSDRGIRLVFRKDEAQLPWDQIQFFEITEPKEGESQQRLVFIATGPDFGHLLDDVTVDRFDELIQRLRIEAENRSIEWVVRDSPT